MTEADGVLEIKRREDPHLVMGTEVQILRTDIRLKERTIEIIQRQVNDLTLQVQKYKDAWENRGISLQQFRNLVHGPTGYIEELQRSKEENALLRDENAKLKRRFGNQRSV